jgi:hypothetical protein
VVRIAVSCARLLAFRALRIAITSIEEERQALEEGRNPLVVSMIIHNDRRTQDER